MVTTAYSNDSVTNCEQLCEQSDTPPDAAIRTPSSWRLGSDPKSGTRPSLVKPSLVHTWGKVPSMAKVPNDPLILQVSTLEVDLFRLSRPSHIVIWSLTLA